MPAKPKRTARGVLATQRRASASQERAEADCSGGGSGCAQDNAPREPGPVQRRANVVKSSRAQTVRVQGAVDHPDILLTPDDAKAIRQASLRARRRGLH
jgi:hypothetical protein